MCFGRMMVACKSNAINRILIPRGGHLTIQDFGQQDISFSELLDTYSYDMPERGQILDAVVLEADERELLLDVGLKRDAIVTYKDLDYLEDSVIDSLIPGAETLAYVLKPYNTDGDLIVSINKALELEDWQKAIELMDNDEVVEVLVTDTNRGGALVQFGRLQGFVPNSHMYTDKSAIVGQTVRTKLIEIDRRRNRLVLSEREAKFEEKRAIMAKLNVGDTVSGKVVHITDFGAFVDIGGADGLVHISNIVHEHISHPSDIIEVGQEIDVLIESIDIERERISLSRKALLPDPWEVFTAHYHVGDLMEGQVTNVVDYGIFVASPSGMEGLVHTSKMKTLNLSHPSDMFKAGDEVLIRILDIDSNRQRVQMDIDSVSYTEQTEWMQSKREDEVIEENQVEDDEGFIFQESA